MKEIAITHIPMYAVSPNPWNPNKQNERQYQAEIESILDNGFISPILVRTLADGYEIIDGEHRYKALKDIAEQGLTGKENISYLIESQTIPAVVIDISDAKAKRLTIIMNETRGQADLADLGHLLSEIQVELGDLVLLGLPYTEAQLKELTAIGDFNWNEYDGGGHKDDFETTHADGYKVTALLDTETQEKWQGYLAEMKDELPEEPSLAAGALIGHLLAKAGK